MVTKYLFNSLSLPLLFSPSPLIIHFCSPSSPLPPPRSLLVHVQAGTAAEVVSGALWTPMEVIKQKLQAQSASNEKVYSGAIHGIREVLKSEGVKIGWACDTHPPTFIWSCLPTHHTHESLSSRPKVHDVLIA